MMIQAVKGERPDACFGLKMLWSCLESVIQPLNPMVVINKCVMMFFGALWIDQKMLDGHSIYRSYRKHKKCCSNWIDLGGHTSFHTVQQ